MLGDTITNPLVENLGTELDSYDYEKDNRIINVIRANDLLSELSEIKNDLETKDYINDKNVNKEVYDKYQALEIKLKAILKSDTTLVKDTKTYKDLINDLIDAYNDFNKPSPKPEPEPKKTITTTRTITVEYVNVDKAYMNGYDDKTFRPNEIITRAELSAVFSRLLNNDIDKEDYTKYSAKYNDLSLNWYHNYIGYLTNRNIFDGYKDNTFKPQNSMTKAEFAKSIVKMFNVKMNKSNNVDNKEIDGRWYKDYLDIMISNYYIDSNYIKTCNEPITRKEVCYIVNVAKGRKIKTKETLTKEESDYIKNNYKDLNENDPYYYHIVSALLDVK